MALEVSLVAASGVEEKNEQLTIQNIIAAAAVVGLIAVVSIGLYFAIPNFQQQSSMIETTTITSRERESERSILVTVPSSHFPTGYASKVVNLSILSNGDKVTVGQTNFWLEIPSNLETRTTTINGMSTVITITVDYLCGNSLGQREFFNAGLANGDDFRLDCCLILNNAVQTIMRSNNGTLTMTAGAYGRFL